MWTRRDESGVGVPLGIFLSHAAAWVVAAAFGCYIEPRWGFAVVPLGVLSCVFVWVGYRVAEQKRWVRPLRSLADHIRRIKDDPTHSIQPADSLPVSEVVQALRELRNELTKANRTGKGEASLASDGMDSGDFGVVEPEEFGQARDISKFGLFVRTEPTAARPESGRADIVSRLDPTTLRWVGSSPGEREFLGATDAILMARRYPDVVHPEDRDEALRRIRGAVAAGGAHDLRWRIRRLDGTTRRVVVHLAVQPASGGSPGYVRLQTLDESERPHEEKRGLERERNMAGLNRQLSRISAELRDLTETNVELYDDAPVMYFSLDDRFRFLDCNKTMTETLGRSKESLVGRPFASIFPEGTAPFDGPERDGQEVTWLKADGGEVHVWFATSVVSRRDGSFGFTRGVALDETERRRLQVELREKNRELEQTIAELSRRNRELDEFTHVVSHDLLEPVRSLISFSAFLREDYGDRFDLTGREYLDRLVDASNRQRSLIRDLLSLSRAGRFTSEFRPVDMNETARVAISDLSGLIREREAQVRLDGNLPTILGDRGRMLQLLGNLIANAIKYNRSAPPAVTISGRLDADGESASIFVKDNGIGIPEHARARVFEMFRQLHPRGDYEGTGAGLAICRKIAQAHGGSIAILESKCGEGGGTTFEARLPAAGRSQG